MVRYRARSSTECRADLGSEGQAITLVEYEHMPGAGNSSSAKPARVREPPKERKNFMSKNEPTRLSKAKVKRIIDRRIGCNAALDKLTSEELCQDLANKALRKIIARRKRWRPRRASACHYSELATEVFVLVLPSLEKLSPTLDDLMREYILAFLDNDHERFVLPPALLNLLAKEYIRDWYNLEGVPL